jgi:hypothetical protein
MRLLEPLDGLGAKWVEIETGTWGGRGENRFYGCGGNPGWFSQSEESCGPVEDEWRPWRWKIEVVMLHIGKLVLKEGSRFGWHFQFPLALVRIV